MRSNSMSHYWHAWLTFRMHPSYTCLPDVFLHLCRTRILYNSDLISISFDVLNSGIKSKEVQSSWKTNIKSRKGWEREKLTGLSALRYQGAEDIYWGMWGLISFPSSSTSAGASPALRASSNSSCLRWSSLDLKATAIPRRETIKTMFYNKW